MIDFASGRRLLPACSFLLLFSCSSEPSGSEISSAINRALLAEQGQVKQLTLAMGGTSTMANVKATHVSELEKVRCKQIDQSAYVCDVRYKISGGLMGESRTPAVVPVRMVRSDGEWLVATR